MIRTSNAHIKLLLSNTIGLFLDLATTNGTVKVNGFASEIISSDERLLGILGVGSSEFNKAVRITEMYSSRTIDSIGGENSYGNPGFVIKKRHLDGQRFSLCRSLCDYMTAENERLSIASTAVTRKQKMNRSFAAEFLAPADLIRAKLANPAVTDDEIELISKEFSVFSWVVRYQIQNQIPEISLTEPGRA